MTEEREKKEHFWLRMASNLLDPYLYNEDKAWEKIRKKTINRPGRTIGWKWLKYAAVFTGGIGMALWGYHTLYDPSEKNIELAGKITSNLQQAELILASGTRVILTDSLRGQNMLHSGMLVHLDSAVNRLEYGQTDTLTGEMIMGYNTLRVPKGSLYTLALPDGTEVCLNSETSLRFPVAFEKGKREVFLEGEAFFKVAPDKSSPFHVYAAGREICVLGTTFNVSAYGNEPYFRSTLVTGKVKVSGGEQSVILKPSEQYTENQESGAIEVERVDIQLYTSWMEGKIVFKGERLEEIIKKLQRWFDFEIFYANQEVQDMKFRGVIYKNDSFDTVLRNLERIAEDIQFSIHGNTVIARKIYNN